MRLVITLAMASALAGCAPGGKVAELGECARAAALHVEAAERMDRLAAAGSTQIATIEANSAALVSSTKYRDAACGKEP